MGYKINLHTGEIKTIPEGYTPEGSIPIGHRLFQRCECGYGIVGFPWAIEYDYLLPTVVLTDVLTGDVISQRLGYLIPAKVSAVRNLVTSSLISVQNNIRDISIAEALTEALSIYVPINEHTDIPSGSLIIIAANTNNELKLAYLIVEE